MIFEYKMFLYCNILSAGQQTNPADTHTHTQTYTYTHTYTYTYTQYSRISRIVIGFLERNFL